MRSFSPSGASSLPSSKQLGRPVSVRRVGRGNVSKSARQLRRHAGSCVAFWRKGDMLDRFRSAADLASKCGRESQTPSPHSRTASAAPQPPIDIKRRQKSLADVRALLEKGRSRSSRPDENRSASCCRAGDRASRATYRATELRGIQRTERSEDGLNTAQPPVRIFFRCYRAQEVAGSSPASSIRVFRCKCVPSRRLGKAALPAFRSRSADRPCRDYVWKVVR